MWGLHKVDLVILKNEVLTHIDKGVKLKTYAT